MELTREMIIQNQYINLPVKNGAPMRKMRFRVDGEIIRVFDIELADEEPDFWVFSDVTAFRGQRLVVEVDDLDPGSQALEAIIQGDAIEGAEDPGEASPAVSLLVAPGLEQRSQRAGVLQGGIPLVLPAQPVRLEVGQYALGPRDQQGSSSLAGAS